MALVTIRSRSELEKSYVLAPERYDPRRGSLPAHPSAISLGEIAAPVRNTVSPSKANSGRYLVLDTSDAQEGVVICRKPAVPGSELGSVKKVVKAGDVIISRLRPYLRQVAYVDRAVRNWEEDVVLACSTEYYVLRAIDAQPIAFIVPFLLSDAVQEVLAASQEGGHHPRFGEDTLLTLPVPKLLLEERSAWSRDVMRSVELFRESEQMLCRMIELSHDKLT
jgi:hypothetical protein